MLNFSPTWNPGFAHFELAQGVVFISEENYFFIRSKEYSELALIIAQNQKLSDYVFQENNMHGQIERINRVDALIENKILLEGKGNYKSYDRPGAGDSPGFLEIPQSIKSAKLQLHTLTKIAEEDVKNLATRIAAHIYSHFPHITDLNLVFVDDYLDPAIVSLAAKFAEQKAAWLLTKLSGESHRLGPYFAGQSNETPCFQCLYVRLVSNNPVREWLRRQLDVIHLPTAPTSVCLEDSLASIEYFSEDIGSILTATDTALLLERNINRKNTSKHPVYKRPQCKNCGDENAFQIVNQYPLPLSNALRLPDTDGGFRCVQRNDTVNKINKLVDPLTGIINDIKKISTSDQDDTLSIFRAAYFQNPYTSEKPDMDTFVQLSLGKGISEEQALSSALGEALERQAAQYSGDEKYTFATPEKLAHRAFLPQQLSPFSDRQYAEFENFTEASLANPQWVRKYHSNIAMHWVEGWSYTNNESVYFPATYCFANTPFEDHVYSLYNHNGNAAGNTNEEAILQGCLELIERDAAAIWWYNQIPRPELDLNIIADKALQIIKTTLDAEWDYWLLDISTDIKIPCCVAVGRHKVNNGFVLGFGAHLDLTVACSRALTEMYQLIVIKEDVSGPFDFNALEAQPFLFPKRNTAKRTSLDFPFLANASIKDDILYLEEILKARQLELCVVSYSRPDIGLKTLKVIVPGLCHFWPQFGSYRLYNTPLTMACLSKALKEQQLNPVGLYL